MIREASDPTVDVVHEDVELDAGRATEALAPAKFCKITLSYSAGGSCT
jgi:hypothetical protein